MWPYTDRKKGREALTGLYGGCSSAYVRHVNAESVEEHFRSEKRNEVQQGSV